MIKLLQNTYSGKKILLTGHTGFKGAWMLALLQHIGAEVKGFALEAETEVNLFGLLNGNSLCQSVIADVRNLEKVKKEICSFEPDFIFHLAAQAIVRRSYTEPTETFDTNIMGTANVLEAARQLKNPCTIVVVTTDKVYENKEWWYPYREIDALGGYDPYSASKACAEIVSSSYRNSYFNPEKYSTHKKAMATARAGNVIGGGDWSTDRIIPDLIKALENNEPLTVRNPNAVRPWQHVMEPIGAYLWLGMKLSQKPETYCQAYNFGPYPEDTLPVQSLVEMALSRWGSGTYQTSNANRQQEAPHEANLLRLDISKAHHELGWRPKLNASEALGLTLDWYKNYKKDPVGITLNQLENYFRM